MTPGESIYVYRFDVRDRMTGLWKRAPRRATQERVARAGGRIVRGSGRLVFPEVVGSDGFLSPRYDV